MRSDVFRASPIVASISAIIASMWAMRASSSVTSGSSKDTDDGRDVKVLIVKYAPGAAAAPDILRASRDLKCALS